MIRIIFSTALILSEFATHAQDENAMIATEDSHYFDFWEGTWHAIKDDNTIDSTVWFKVTRSVHPAAFYEEWKFANGARSVALRAWDKTNNKWEFVWISDNGLYQEWDTKKTDSHWYIYKHFTINGDTYLSRQGFLLQADGTVLRISEKSYDEKKWDLRFKQCLKKIK